MKDRTKATAPSPDNDDVKVYDLTPEMAVPDQEKYKIVNLINAMDDESSEQPPSAPMQPQVRETAPAPKEVQQPDTEDTSTVTDETEDAPAPEETSTVIEKEVDAAFNAAEALSAVDDDQLLDDMTNLTALVDSAIEQPGDKNLAQADPLPSDDIEDLLDADKEDGDETPTLAFDEDQLAADAAALETALSADSGMDDAIGLTEGVDMAEPEVDIHDQSEDAIIELTEKVDPEELSLADDARVDEEILELTDIVDPDEPEPIVAQEPEEEIIELTEIVDPAELEALQAAAAQDPDDEIIELTEIVDPAEFEAAMAQVPKEEIIELNDIVSPADLESASQIDSNEEIIELTDIVNPAELDRLDDNQDKTDIIELTDILARHSSGAAINGIEKSPSEAQSDEDLIRLSDVLNRKAKQDDASSTSKNASDEAPQE